MSQSSSFLDAVIDSLVHVLQFVWKIEQKGEISGLCCDTLEAMARAFLLIPRYCNQLVESSEVFLRGTVNKMLEVVTILCANPALALSGEARELHVSLSQLPFSSSWLTPELRLLALRSFNLCLATNVSLFSGWEEDEFNVRLLRNGRVPHFFGATIVDTQIVGFMSEETEKLLSSQWQLVDRLFPSTFKFDHELSILHSTYWYEEGKERLESAKMKQKISCFGEEHGLSVLLSFSYSCLRLAIDCKHPNPVSPFTALSILIPITQYCLGIPIWDINFGEAAVLSRSNVVDWQNFDWDKDDLPPSNRPGYLRPKLRSSYNLPAGAKALHEWFEFENEHDALSNIIGLPMSLLQQEWNKYIHDNPGGNGSIDGSEWMEKLHTCMNQLRGCYSEVAVERACLRVSSALIHLAASRECHNRFLCIQQAALFASQASKGGSSDQYFHSPLPTIESCTPLDALLTKRLGFTQRRCFYVPMLYRLVAYSEEDKCQSLHV
jgi:hypothetical protein